MPEVLIEVEKKDDWKARWVAGCDKYGAAAFALAVHDLLRQGAKLESAMRQAGESIEHARLQSAVVEAAKKRHDAQSDFWDEAYRGSQRVVENAALHQANCDLRVVVEALIAFEREHKIGQLNE